MIFEYTVFDINDSSMTQVSQQCSKPLLVDDCMGLYYPIC
jgi:hypothetical protein